MAYQGPEKCFRSFSKPSTCPSRTCRLRCSTCPPFTRQSDLSCPRTSRDARLSAVLEEVPVVLVGAPFDYNRASVTWVMVRRSTCRVSHAAQADWSSCVPRRMMSSCKFLEAGRHKQFSCGSCHSSSSVAERETALVVRENLLCIASDFGGVLKSTTEGSTKREATSRCWRRTFSSLRTVDPTRFHR